MDGAIGFELGGCASDCAHGDAEEADGEDDAGVTELLKAREGDDGSFAKLGHVGEEVGRVAVLSPVSK